ncbi:MAG: hypothetical protein A3H17_04610 [Candidatus Levybacteria bacterium RIFCSPLOWO2_12_FULL_37_14]|nr:MAG: hypothetical protein A3H17_04610 [Candidatus Levybacteria bacterium RIFCSPLOWO2_12_FULL_37_14]
MLFIFFNKSPPLVTLTLHIPYSSFPFFFPFKMFTLTKFSFFTPVISAQKFRHFSLSRSSYVLMLTRNLVLSILKRSSKQPINTFIKFGSVLDNPKSPLLPSPQYKALKRINFSL